MSSARNMSRLTFGGARPGTWRRFRVGIRTTDALRLERAGRLRTALLQRRVVEVASAAYAVLFAPDCRSTVVFV